MSESEVKLLNSPYGEVTYESFRKLKRAFADKSAMIKSLDDNGMTLYPVLRNASTTYHMLTDMKNCSTRLIYTMNIWKAITPIMY